MPAAQRFLVVFFLVVLPILTGLIGTAIWIGPLDGPLTRMGGYAERDFGWHGKQPTVGIEDASVANYQPADVLVIGDSFSKPGLWQAYFKRDTGLSVTTLDLGKTSFDSLLLNPAYLAQPPRIVVIESVEVFFLTKFRQANPECPNTANIRPQVDPITIEPTTIPFKHRERAQEVNLINLNLKYAWAYWRQVWSGHDNTSVAQFALKRPGLFSNRLSEKLLVYRPDLEKSAWQNDDIAAALCQLLALQHGFQTNRETVFAFLLVPDKLTTYTPFIANPANLPMLDLNNKLIEKGIQTPNLIQNLQQAITNGEIDIYLPNETHFGARGHEIMAQTLTRYLQDLGVFKD